jgi:ABC-type dipeptide/oligopeptide/nickel transport system ATPase component
MDAGSIVEEGPAREVLAAPQNARTQAFLRAIL